MTYQLNDSVTELEEEQLFAHMVRHHDPTYYQGLFDSQLEFQYRGMPIRTHDGGTTNPEYDNCVNSPPNYPEDPDYPDRYCVGGYFCKLSDRRWGCKRSIPKSPTNNRGYNPK
jgi:hypothetical protein